MSAPICPCCGVDAVHDRILIGNHDRGAIRIRACCLCGEQIGPIMMTVADPASTSSLDVARPASKPARAIDPSSSWRAS